MVYEQHLSINFLNSPLTHPRVPHRIAPNMFKSTRWFVFYYYFTAPNSAALGGA
jgi:hypothetical protein